MRLQTVHQNVFIYSEGRRQDGFYLSDKETGKPGPGPQGPRALLVLVVFLVPASLEAGGRRQGRREGE